MGRTQTATEYLVILSVVVIIALITIGTLGGIPFIGGRNPANCSVSSTQ